MATAEDEIKRGTALNEAVKERWPDLHHWNWERLKKAAERRQGVTGALFDKETWLVFVNDLRQKGKQEHLHHTWGVGPVCFDVVIFIWEELTAQTQEELRRAAQENRVLWYIPGRNPDYTGPNK
jgi:hypothetical protein